MNLLGRWVEKREEREKERRLASGCPASIERGWAFGRKEIRLKTHEMADRIKKGPFLPRKTAL
jgi:hypothetical protein